MANSSQPVDMHEEHRKLIAEATRDIRSPNWPRKSAAIDALIHVLDFGLFNAYHKAQACSLLATHGDPGDVEVDEYAKECIDECKRVIMQERMNLNSYARQPWDDLINSGRAVLRQIREEEKEAWDYKRALARIDAGLEDEDEDNDDGDEFNDDEDMDDKIGDFEDEDEQAEGEADQQLVIHDDSQFIHDFNQAFEEAEEADKFALPKPIHVDLSFEVNPDPTALENRITLPDGRQLAPYNAAAADHTFFERDVDIEDARLIQVFVLLLLQFGPACRLDMQRLLEAYTTEKMIASEDILGQMTRELEGLVIRAKPREIEEVEDTEEAEECD